MAFPLPESPSDWQPILGPLLLADAECRALTAALQDRPTPAIRLRPGISPEQLFYLELAAVPWHDRTYFVRAVMPPTASASQFPGYFQALYYIQDAGSLLAVRLASAQAGQVVCDLCAAPGGKTTALLEEMHEMGWVLANEAIADRLAALQFNLYRHGSSRYLVSHGDPEQLAEALPGCFDLVLVDAPCTGQSLLSRGRQTESAFDVAQIEFCAARQQRILDAAAVLVRAGGSLIYSTCTFSYLENEGCLEAFLRRHPEWHMEPEPALTPWQSPVMPGAYRLWPHRDGCAGAFAARLRRCGEAVLRQPGGRRPMSAARYPRPAEVSPSAPRASQAWGEVPSHAFFWRQTWQWFATADEPPLPLWDIACGGPEFAFVKGKSLFPAYALAMRRHGWWMPRQTLPLDLGQMADYVRGNPLRCSVRDWAVATYQGHPLGWLKGDGRVGKNHLPRPGRYAASTPPPWFALSHPPAKEPTSREL